MSLLQIYHQVCQRKNFENWLISGEVMGKSLVSCFFDSQCIESRKSTGLSGLHMDWSDWLVPEETFTVCGLVVSWLDMRLKGCGFESRPFRFGQVVHTHVPLSPSSISWYRSRGGDALRLGR